MNIKRCIPMVLLIGFFMGIPFHNACAEGKGCIKSERCENIVSDCRCAVNGECLPDAGNKCYEIKECDPDGKWVHYSCHYATTGYKQCPGYNKSKLKQRKKS